MFRVHPPKLTVGGDAKKNRSWLEQEKAQIQVRPVSLEETSLTCIRARPSPPPLLHIASRLASAGLSRGGPLRLAGSARAYFVLVYFVSKLPYLPTYLPTYLLTYLPTYLPT